MYFTDGSRINSKLINEFLSRATNMKEAEETSAILSGASPENIKKAETGEKPTVTIKSQNTSQSTDVFDEDSLMVGILEKLSKKNKTNLDVSVGIHLPSKTIFKALQQDVDDDELRRGLEKLVKKQINNIEEQLNNQVEQFIQNYYYEQTRKKKSV
jgi:phosphoenolpyruvate-protein kinase (PTS system EI component)